MYTDVESTIWTWTCATAPVASNPTTTTASTASPFKQPDTDWIQIIIWIGFVAGAFWIFGYPLYILMGIIANWYYIITWWISLFAVFDNPDSEEYSFINFILFPWRKAVVFYVCFLLGIYLEWVPIVGFVALPLLGFAAWTSETDAAWLTADESATSA